MVFKKNTIPFPTSRRKTRHLSKKDKFKVFSATRMPKLLRAMKSVGNLANKRYYDYKDWERDEIMKDIREAWNEMYGAWKDAGKKKKKNNKKSYWDQKNGNN